jgi:creatinine amidohydrolase
MTYSIFDDTMVMMAWPAIEKAAGRGASVLLPLGIIEEHGPHLGLAVDTFAAHLLSVMAKRELESRGIEALVAPPCYWGISRGTASFAGTFSVRADTVKSIIADILVSLKSWNFRQVFVINWHADYHHCRAILEALQEARTNTEIDARYVLLPADVRRFKLSGEEDHILVQKAPPAEPPTGEFVDYHAGSLETGIALAYFPEYADANLAKKLEPTRLTNEDLKGLGRSDEETRRLIPGGYFGDPSRYDIDSARRFMEASGRDIADTIADYLKTVP